MGSLEHLHFKIILFIYLFWTVLGLSCYGSFSLLAASGGYSLLAVSGFLSVGGLSCCRAQTLGCVGSVVSAPEAQELSCTGLVAPRHVGSF